MANLRDLREQAFLSRKSLAEKAHVSSSSIVRIEEESNHRAQQDVVERILQALSEALGRPITVNDVEGLQFYNVMRDRRNRRKVKVQQEDKAVA